MWYSIGVKAGMFLITAGALLWIGWSVPVTPPAGLKSDPTVPGISLEHQKAAPLVVQLNQATLEELQTLPGIGPVLAERILTHRKQGGPFRVPEDLLAVKGVGVKRLEGVRPFLRIRDNEKAEPRISSLRGAEQRKVPVL